MSYDIGPKIGIDGEAAFRKELQSINNGLKTLGTEMKAVTADFDGQVRSMEALTAQGDVLSRTILTLRERLELQNRMLAESAKAYGEADARTQKWQQAVNATQAELSKAEGQLRKNVDAINASSDATGKLTAEIDRQEKELAELQRAYSNAVLEQGKHSDQAKNLRGQIQNLSGSLEQNKARLDEATNAMDKGTTGANNLSGVIGGTLPTAAGVALAAVELLAKAVEAYADFVKDAVTESAAYADEILTLSTNTGLSTEQLQKFEYMAELIDTPVETVTSSLVKLTRSMVNFRDGNADATEAFHKLGLELDTVIGPDGQLRSNEEVFYTVITALGQIENQTERDAVSMAIFGKSAQDLNSLIAAGVPTLQALGREAENVGYVLGEEDLQALGAVDDSFQRWDRTMEAVKNRIGVELAPVIVDLADKAIEFAQSIDWEQVGSATAAVLETVGNAVITLADNLETIGNVVAAITNPVEYLLNKLDELTGKSSGTSSIFSNATSTRTSAASISTPSYTQWQPAQSYDADAVARIEAAMARQASAASQPINVNVQFTGSNAQVGRALEPVITAERGRQGTNLTGR